tara:strand:+ start:298 stop:561 length:264 start_codon:yes stop_codon:yes gene_type:complete
VSCFKYFELERKQGDGQMVNSIGSKLKIYNVNTGQNFEGVIMRNGSNFMQIIARKVNTGLSYGMISLQKDEPNKWIQSETDITFVLL